jgi:uncharacterized protein (TIGR03663 family)
MQKWMPILFLLILAAALGLRLPHLADRPMHHDEANQAYRAGVLLETGTYVYDADDHHGPTLYYLTKPIAQLTGAKTFSDTNEITYRILPVMFGFLLILCTPLLRNSVGCHTVLFAALFTAISPAMAYYSRFYIQEMLLVFFTFITIVAGWHTWFKGSKRWAIICGISAGLMFATKETAVIAYAAIIGSAMLCRWIDPKASISIKKLSIVVLFAAGTALLLFSSFFTNLDGALESLQAFKGYFARGTGIDTDHVHPWNFYLKMLTVYRFDGGPIWSEGLITGLGLVGAVAILRKKIPTNCNLLLARFLLFYTLLLTLAYSALAYKTPWCMLSFLHGWILLAGIGAASLLFAAQNSKAPRLLSSLVWIAILTAAYPTYRLAERTVFRYSADPRNPYVYAHTAPDFMNLINRIHEMEAISPKGKGLYIQVIADPKEMWPLPFYLRDYPDVGYWIPGNPIPSELKPDLIISAPDFEPDATQFISEFYGLRPDILLAIHIDRSLWDAFIETRK